MNKILLVGLCLGLVTFSRCKPERGGPPAEEYQLTESDIVGSWAVDRFSSDYHVSGTFLGEDVDRRGTTRISNSDLQLQFGSDGTWVSTGQYSLTVASEEQQEVTRHQGIGRGAWSFRNDTLYLDGLENYSGDGTFSPRQACAVADFTQFLSIDFITRIDQTDMDPNYDITIRTEADWKIDLVR